MPDRRVARPDEVAGQPRKRASEKKAALFYLADRTNKDLTHVAAELGLTRSDCVELALGELIAKHAHLIRRP